jgi:hypothetical protein
MTAAMMRAYRENRSRFSVNDLAPYDGQWVAFRADGQRIVASADAIKDLAERVRAAGENLQDVVLERIEFQRDDVELGGAELL